MFIIATTTNPVKYLGHLKTWVDNPTEAVTFDTADNAYVISEILTVRTKILSLANAIEESKND